MKSKEESRARIKWILIIILTSVGVYLGFKYLLPLILPFLVAYFLAWMVRPITEFLFRKMKIPRIVGSTISLTVLIFAAGVGIYYLLTL